jgi:hypothetical protein
MRLVVASGLLLACSTAAADVVPTVGVRLGGSLTADYIDCCVYGDQPVGVGLGVELEAGVHLDRTWAFGAFLDAGQLSTDLELEEVMCDTRFRHLLVGGRAGYRVHPRVQLNMSVARVFGRERERCPVGTYEFAWSHNVLGAGVTVDVSTTDRFAVQMSLAAYVPATRDLPDRAMLVTIPLLVGVVWE